MLILCQDNFSKLLSFSSGFYNSIEKTAYLAAFSNVFIVEASAFTVFLCHFTLMILRFKAQYTSFI